LRVAIPKSEASSQTIDLLKVQVMSVIHSGYYRIAV